MPTRPVDTVAPSELWRILWHRRRLVFAIAGLLLGLAAAYCLVTPRLYTATAQILVDPRDKQVFANDLNPSVVAADGGVVQVESQASVVQSSNVLSRAIAATHLDEDPEFSGPGLASRLVALLTGQPPVARSASDVQERTLEALRRRLTVRRADKVLVIDIAVTAKSADRASQLANAVADAYLADQTAARAQSAEEAAKSLTARLDEQRQRVQDAENAVQRYRVAHNIVVATGQVVSEQQLNEANAQLAAAQSRVATLKAQIDQLQQQRTGDAGAGATAEALQSTVISKLREQESVLAQREAYQTSQLGPRHPDVATTTMQLRNVRRSIDAELDRIVKAAKADYDRAVANERALSAKLDALKRQTQANDAADVGLRELQRDADALRSVYASYLVRAQETREQANIDSTNARIITRALPPRQSSWPPFAFLLAGALGAGLGIGSGAALMFEYVDPTVLSRSQAEMLAHAPVIGVLPALRRGGKRWLGRRKAPASNGTGESRVDGIMGHVLRRLFGTNTGPASRSVLVASSAEDGPVRYRVVRLLAATAAAQGERVLLIDAGPVDSATASSPGLMEVLRGECTLERAVRYEAIVASAPGCGIAVMSPGRYRPVSREAVAFAFAKRMLAQAKQEFDLVIVDGGEMAESVNASALASAVGEVVLVLALNVSRHRAVSATTDRLGAMGRGISALILVDPMTAA